MEQNVNYTSVSILNEEFQEKVEVEKPQKEFTKLDILFVDSGSWSSNLSVK